MVQLHVDESPEEILDTLNASKLWLIKSDLADPWKAMHIDRLQKLIDAID